VVTLVDGKTYVVLETAAAVVDRITNYRASVLAAAERHLSEQDENTDLDDEGGTILHLRPALDRGC
jgi:hypothetical protein